MKILDLPVFRSVHAVALFIWENMFIEVLKWDLDRVK